MQQNGDGRVVLISGTNRGIGAAISHHLLACGYRISMGCRRQDELESIYGPQGTSLHFSEFDAYRPETAQTWVDSAIKKFGRIDALVNNAGSNEQVSLLDENEEALDRLWAVNVKAPLRLTRLCLPHLEKTGRGRVVNVVSLSGKRVRNSSVGYNMTKFAAMGLTHTTRQVGWDKGIRATAVCPSFVRSDMSANTYKVSPEDMIQPETIADLVRTAIELPNNAAVAELLVNCRLEDTL